MHTAVHDLQAIQARQVLRGTVAELVKETRRQEAEGVPSFLLALNATLFAATPSICSRAVQHAIEGLLRMLASMLWWRRKEGHNLNCLCIACRRQEGAEGGHRSACKRGRRQEEGARGGARQLFESDD